MDYDQIRDRLVEVCVRYSHSAEAEPHSSYDAELEYCDDMILEQARLLVAAAPR
jgi:hypothetical protein